MITLIFRAKIRPGKEDEALAKLKAMAESVQANEPGALVYAVHQTQDDPAEVLFWEAYEDEAAFKSHSETPHMGALRSAFAELFDVTTVKLERLNRVGGFVRGS
jgi:quinol monooxygenase YgiN